MGDNCITCLFSEYKETDILINDLTGTDNATCKHINSPYYNELVNENKSCRLYIDSIKYFKQKDRKEKIDELKRNKL